MATMLSGRPPATPDADGGHGDRAELAHLAYVITDLRGLARSGHLRQLAGTDVLDRYLSRRAALLAPAPVSVTPPAAPIPAVAAPAGGGGAARPKVPPPPRPPAPSTTPATPRSPVEPAVILLWLGAFLVTIASLIFVAYNWAAMSGPVKTALMAGLAAGFLAAGYVTGRRVGLRPASTTFYAIGATLTPLTFVAAYNFWLRAGNLDWRALGTLAALVSAALYARLAVARLGAVYAWAAVAAGGAALGFLLLLLRNWAGLWPALLVVLAYAGLTWAPRLREAPWADFRRPLLALAGLLATITALVLIPTSIIVTMLWPPGSTFARDLTIDLVVTATVLGLAATQHGWRWLAGSALVVATLAAQAALIAAPALVTVLGGPNASQRLVLIAGAALAALASLRPSATWQSCLRWYALIVALVAPWLGLVGGWRLWQAWPITPAIMTAGLAVIWLTALLWRRTRPTRVLATAAVTVAGYGALVLGLDRGLIGGTAWASLGWAGFAFAWLAAIALALAAEDEPLLDLPAAGLLAVGVVVTPFPWPATVASAAAVLLWLVADGRLPLGARAHWPAALAASALATATTVVIGVVLATMAWQSADWYPVTVPLLGLTVLGLLVANRYRLPVLAAGPLLTGTLALVTAIAAQPFTTSWIVGLGGFYSAVAAVLVALGALALLLAPHVPHHWRLPMRVYALTVSLIAPWLATADWLPAISAAAVAVIWPTAVAGKTQRSPWQWTAAAAATGGYAILATTLPPTLAGWLGVAFTLLAAVALALAAADEAWLDLPAVALVVAGLILTPVPWHAAATATVAVPLWLVGSGRLSLGARDHRPAALILAMTAVAVAVTLGLIRAVAAWTTADWYPITAPLLALTVLGLLVAQRHRRPILTVAPLVTGTLTIVSAIAAQTVTTPWIVALGGFDSAVAVILTGLAGLSLLATWRAPQHWRDPLRGYAALVGAIAPWWTVAAFLPAITTAGLAVAWTAVATWAGPRPRWLWVTTGVALAGFAALAALLAPTGLLGATVAGAGASWTVLGFFGLLAAGVAVLTVLDRRPTRCYAALGLLLVGLTLGVGTSGITALATVLWFSGAGAGLALAALLASRRWPAFARPPADGGAALALAGVVIALGSGGWLAPSSPLGPALFLLMVSLALVAGALHRAWLGEVASAAGVGWLLHLFLTQQRADPQWYSLPIGLWLAALALARGRRGDLVSANVLTAVSAVAIIGPTLLQSLTYTDTGWRYFLVGLAEAVAFLAVGLRWRLRVPTLAGVLGLGLIAGYQVFDGLRSLPNWAILGIIGAAMLVVAVALLWLRERITRGSAELHHQWQTWR